MMHTLPFLLVWKKSTFDEPKGHAYISQPHDKERWNRTRVIIAHFSLYLLFYSDGCRPSVINFPLIHEWADPQWKKTTTYIRWKCMRMEKVHKYSPSQITSPCWLLITTFDHSFLFKKIYRFFLVTYFINGILSISWHFTYLYCFFIIRRIVKYCDMSIWL
jgi:hypothetical protein